MTDPQQPISRRAARNAAAGPPVSSSTEPGTAADDSAAHKRVILIAVAAAVTFLLLGTGAVFAGLGTGKRATPVASPTVSTPTPASRAVPADEVAVAGIPTCSISALATKTTLGKLYGSVLTTSGGQALYSALPDDPQAPASGLKLLTAAAAIAKLGPNFQITTKVVDGVTPGSITLVGEGDPTLSAVAAGDSVYTGAPTMASLASKTVAAYNIAHPGVPITQVVLDSTYWDPTDNWNSAVPRSEQTGGFLSETTALQVDGDRQNPKLQVSPRSSDPIAAAGKAFAAALASALGQSIPINVTTGQQEDGAPTLASVKSQPVSVLVKQMLLNNDDTLAESLARIISVQENLDGTSSSIQQAITQALAGYGLDTSGLSIGDGSGESPDSAIPASFMAKFMALVNQGKGNMAYVKAGIPLAGRTGGLMGRFIGGASAGVGHVFAMPGSISNAYTLTGYMTAKDGTGLSFAFFAEGGGVTASANATLDALASAVYSCGKNLTTY
ncbi:MAG: D-alanyl-D-alanine carboxypeptidase/D-alanyl-D-alanine-endopeptidase [Glaciihabitans sp.]|nr:D-alanyl-D-alanine carboxypeptidase/D-alanyl-D-alanine-endopeptidase [Glaciihabitans sp.]